LAVLVPTFVYRHARLGILTEQTAELIDVTDGLDSLLTAIDMSIGFLKVQSLQPGAGIIVTAAPSSPPDRVAMAAGARLSVINGHLDLDGQQRVFLVEREGPAARELAVVIIGEARR
jgi:thiamine phosphate synthase YjbQ (UPF0047 family)